MPWSLRVASLHSVYDYGGSNPNGVSAILSHVTTPNCTYSRVVGLRLEGNLVWKYRYSKFQKPWCVLQCTPICYFTAMCKIYTILQMSRCSHWFGQIRRFLELCNKLSYGRSHFSRKVLARLRHIEFLPHCMQCSRGLATRKLGRPFLCQTRRGLWRNGRKICPDFYTIWKII